MRDAVRRVCDVAQKHGKSAGIGGVPDAALAREYAAMGARLVLAGNDLAMLLDGLRRRAASLRD